MNAATAQGQAEQLRAKLIALTGRMVGVEEVRKALELKVSTYYLQDREERLLTAENLKKVARNLGIDELQLMIECGIISEEALNSYNQNHGWRRLPPPL